MNYTFVRGEGIGFTILNLILILLSIWVIVWAINRWVLPIFPRTTAANGTATGGGTSGSTSGSTSTIPG